MPHRDPIHEPTAHAFDFRWLVEENLAGIYLVRNDRFLYVNSTMAELFGYTPEEIVRERTVEDLVASSDRRRVRQKLRQRVGGEVDLLHYTFRGLRRDGSLLDVEVRGRRTHSRDGPAILGTLLDVTERTQERERLRFLARAAELLDSSLDYETTLESLTRLMIPSFADLCFIDIARGEETRRMASVAAGNKDVDVVDLGAPAEVGLSYPSAEEVLQTGRGVLLETVPVGVERQVLFRLPPHSAPPPAELRSLLMVPLVARGAAIGVMTLASASRAYTSKDLDFAREVARNAALSVDNASLYREAKVAIARREEVLAIVSHDLRNPLNVILMGTALGMEQERRSGSPLEIVREAGKQMERLIRDLLDLSAIEAGGFSVVPVRKRVGPAVARCVTMLAGAAAESGTRLRTRIDDGSTEALIDEDRLNQAVSNLVSNAIRFTPRGKSVSVSVRTTGRAIRISVSDSGPGIPEDQLGHIFERFWRGEAHSNGGAGLGLAIVRGIAEAHGGGVSVRSRPGRGSTFCLELPIAT